MLGGNYQGHEGNAAGSDIANLPKAEILAALYNASRPLGMGILHFTSKDMTSERAEELIASQDYFDYVQGRVMKVDLTGDSLDPSLYDRDNGEGAAERALAHMLPSTETPQ